MVMNNATTANLLPPDKQKRVQIRQSVGLIGTDVVNVLIGAGSWSTFDADVDEPPVSFRSPQKDPSFLKNSPGTPSVCNLSGA
jgi:hypothetical protein